MTIDWTSWKEPLRDGAIIYALTAIGGFVLGFSGIKNTLENTEVYTAVTMFMGILGFTIIGSITKHTRPQYLPIVALVLWLISLSNVAFGFATVEGWVVGGVSIAIYMLIGGALSYIFVRNTPALPRAEPAGSE